MMIRKRIGARRRLRESRKTESRGQSWKEVEEEWVLEDDVEEESGNFEEELE